MFFIKEKRLSPCILKEILSSGMETVIFSIVHKNGFCAMHMKAR